MGRTDRISGLFWLLVGIAILLLALSYPLGSFREPGGGLYPSLLGCLLILLAVKLLVGSRKVNEVETQPSDPRKIRWGRSVITMIGLFIVPFLFEVFGFFPAMLLFMIFMTKVVMPLPWVTTLATAFLSTAGGYMLFEEVLGIHFPRGLFGL